MKLRIFIFSILLAFGISFSAYCSIDMIRPEIEYKLTKASLDHNIDTNVLRALCFNETTYGRGSQHFNWKEFEKCNIDMMNKLGDLGYPIVNEQGLFLHSIDIGPLQVCTINYRYVEDLCSFEEFFSDVDMQIEASCRLINGIYKNMCNILNCTKEELDLRIVAYEYRYGGKTGYEKYLSMLQTGEQDAYVTKFMGEYNSLIKHYK